MKKSQSTYKSMMFSAVSIVLTMILLLGTTYALFTNSVTSGTNTIKSKAWQGVTFSQATAYDGTYESLSDSFVLFNNVELAPGENTGIKYLKITNANSYDVTASVTFGAVEGASSIVSDNDNHMLFYRKVVNSAPAALTDLGTAVDLNGVTDVINNQTVPAGESVIVAIAVELSSELTVDQIPVTANFIITLGAAQRTGS